MPLEPLNHLLHNLIIQARNCVNNELQVISIIAVQAQLMNGFVGIIPFK